MNFNVPESMRRLVIADHNEHSSMAPKVAAIVLCCTAPLFIGSIAPVARNYLPPALLPALYVTSLAYLGAWLHRTQLLRLMPGVIPVSCIRRAGVHGLGSIQ